MALSVAQKIALYDLLETPYDGSVDQMIGEFGLSAVTRTANSDSQKLQTKIESRLSALVTAEENVLIQYLNEWQLIGTNVAVVDGGAVGGTSGLSYDPTNQLMRIQKSVKNLIPVMQYRKEIVLGREREKGGMNVETVR